MHKDILIKMQGKWDYYGTVMGIKHLAIPVGPNNMTSRGWLITKIHDQY